VPLAVSTPKRSVTLPDVPTTTEAGFKDSDFTFWNGILVPAKTPRAIIDRLHAETEKALTVPEVKEKLAAQGVEPMPLKPQEIDALIKREIANNVALAKSAGLKFN
jgi:tripartite-type tricarboxylate transporter receptor subunit TctC